MEKIQNELIGSKNEITVTLSLPEDFICTCELMNIQYSSALQKYLEHIKIYNYFFTEQEDADAVATALFKKFDVLHVKKNGFQVAEYRELHIVPIKEILRLGTVGKGSRSPEYINVIETWYETISKSK